MLGNIQVWIAKQANNNNKRGKVVHLLLNGGLNTNFTMYRDIFMYKL